MMNKTSHRQSGVPNDSAQGHRLESSPHVVAKAHKQLQTFFDELKNGTQNYRTISSLSSQVTQEYRGRCVLELLQNAHDALTNVGQKFPHRITFVLRTAPERVLLVANTGTPFRRKDFEGITQLGLSPKDPNESVGNKGLGFRSVLELSTAPEIWSIAAPEEEAGFNFRFDPGVSEQVAQAAQDLEKHGLDAKSPFDSGRPLVDWSVDQLQAYRNRISIDHIDSSQEARNWLSPYLIPLPGNEPLPDVLALLDLGHVTVISLPLDGGRTGTVDEAVTSVKNQLAALDARSTIFLPKVEELVIEIDGERSVLERIVDSEEPFGPGEMTRQQTLMAGGTRSNSDERPSEIFRVWTRTVGGEFDQAGSEKLTAAVEHLPNRWPEVRKVTIGVATEESSESPIGVFVIFLPTEVTTGNGCLINAPFYSSLSRLQIDFADPYNSLLLEELTQLCLDIVDEIAAGPRDSWRAKAVLDILSSTSKVGGESWKFSKLLHEASLERGKSLAASALILCDQGWTAPHLARLMPNVPSESLINWPSWRSHAEFRVVFGELAGREHATRALVEELGGSVTPSAAEWASTLESLAFAVHEQKVAADWNSFLRSVVLILPPELQAVAGPNSSDPLASSRFLPTQDGRLLSAGDGVSLFFQPVRGVDDAADLVGDVPSLLQDRIAFLHPAVQTQEGPQRRNTEVQKFLEGRFVRGFRREEILRDVVLPALPVLPVVHENPEINVCADALNWGIKLLGREEYESLLPMIRRLPVPCVGGWYPMETAIFGPGWGNVGELLEQLAKELPQAVAAVHLASALLSPDDSKWPVDLSQRGELLKSAGVSAGLRLRGAEQTGWNVRFQMQGYRQHKLALIPPVDVPEDDWDQWQTYARSEARPFYQSLFQYELSRVWLLPALHHLSSLSRSGAEALMELILASLEHWPENWVSVTLSKAEGQSWSTDITSPLRYWLITKVWLVDRTEVEFSLAKRWLVPDSLLIGQGDRFAHLAPLSVALARRLSQERELQSVLVELGLNLYPTEDDRTGPELLNALAEAWQNGQIPMRRFDVFLGQVRDAWRHLDPSLGLPTKFLVRSGKRAFVVREASNLADVYLPNQRDRARLLEEQDKPLVEMNVHDAGRLANVLTEHTNVRRASDLEERVVIDGARWEDDTEFGDPLEESRYAWLAPVLLAIAAYGGPNPTGAETQTWREASLRLQRTRILECEVVQVQIIDGEKVVGSGEPNAQWLAGEVIAIRRDAADSCEHLIPALQAILDRQDLRKDLLLVLGRLSGQTDPTFEEMEEALQRADIDAQSFADIRHRWYGSTSLLVDRIRPVLKLLGITDDGLDLAAADEERLTGWLSTRQNVWNAHELLLAARRSKNDAAMGEAAWTALGEIAQLPAWNNALRDLGPRYTSVENGKVDEQATAYLRQARSSLRGIARHIAIESGKAELFLTMAAEIDEFASPGVWASRWWQVPFEAVINELRERWEAKGVSAGQLGPLREPTTAEALSCDLEARGIPVQPDPFEVASENRSVLEAAISEVHDIYCAWLELGNGTVTASPLPAQIELDPSAHLDIWSAADVLRSAIAVIANPGFAATCETCTSVESLRDHLGLSAEAVALRREQRLQQEREAERQKRTFEIADTSFEIGVTGYQELFQTLWALALPDDRPRASQDELSPLSNPPPGRGPGGGGGGGPHKSSHLRPVPGLTDLIGVIGEIHAFHFLRTDFGEDVVARDSWVSENRLKVLPLTPGEPNNTSDGLGFDFRFSYVGKTWQIEVKATQADDEPFDLGISEIHAASRAANAEDTIWRVLRVSQARSTSPIYEWLPNPLEDGFRKFFRIEKGGMRISYFPTKN